MPGHQLWVVSFGTMAIAKGFGAPQAAPNEPQGGAQFPRAARLRTMRSCRAYIALPWLSVIIGQEASRR